MVEETVERKHDAELTDMVRCVRCKLRYGPTKSTSSLKLTYCSFLCELGDLGFSMQGLEHMERASKPTEEDESEKPEPVGVD
jgi:hypothetical protein